MKSLGHRRVTSLDHRYFVFVVNREYFIYQIRSVLYEVKAGHNFNVFIFLVFFEIFSLTFFHSVWSGRRDLNPREPTTLSTVYKTEEIHPGNIYITFTSLRSSGLAG